MPEPTDHRAEAEHWAALAAREYSRSLEHAVPAALIGLDHALLALIGPEKPTAIVHLSGNATRQQLRDLLAGQPPQPPLSPSED